MRRMYGVVLRVHRLVLRSGRPGLRRATATGNVKDRLAESVEPTQQTGYLRRFPHVVSFDSAAYGRAAAFARQMRVVQRVLIRRTRRAA